MSQRPFGEFIRSQRLGFAWDEKRQVYVRMTELGPDEFLVEAAGPGNLPAQARRTKHTCWWEGTPEERETLLQSCAPVAALQGFTGFHAWVVDDEGKEKPRHRKSTR